MSNKPSQESLDAIAALAETYREHQRLQTPPYPALKIPKYRTGHYGEWVLKRRDAFIMGGYFTAIQPANPNYILSQGNTLWMSLGPRELESQAHHALYACGHTVIMGLGMGLLLFNAIAPEQVERVTVVERDSSVIELFHKIAQPTTWPGWEKVSFVVADALTWQPDSPVDFLSVDIWPKLGDMRLRENGQRIQRNVQAKQVALWGQELDFIHFLSESGKQPPPTLPQYHEYVQAVGIPLIEANNPNYPDNCWRAAQSVLTFL